jgi:hypothetical protein
MAIQARLADGRVLSFPDGTDPEVINRTVKSMIAAASQQAALSPVADAVQLSPEESSAEGVTRREPKPERKVYTGSVFDTQPFDPKFDPEEAARLSRRDYAERGAQQPRRTQFVQATPKEQIERTIGQAIADTGIGLLQGAAGIPKGIAANINAGDNPIARFYEEAIQAGERSKSPFLQSQKAEREALLKNVLQNQGELAQTRAAFNSMFSPAGADVVAQGTGSMLPTVGMSLFGLGQRAFVATNALANAGEAAQNTARELSQMSPQDWSKSDAYQELRGAGLSHADAVRMLAPLLAMPSQLVGGVAGGLSGATGLEKSLAGKGIRGGARERAGRAGAELLGEQVETLAPSFAGNVTQRMLDEQKSLTEGLGREAVETLFGATPGAALAATGRSGPEAPRELDTRGLADRMARERGFLTPEARTERPVIAERQAPIERRATTPERVEPTFDEKTFVSEPAAQRVGDDLTQQRAQEQADVLDLEGETAAPEKFSYMDEAVKYDTPEMRLKQAEALDGEDVTGLIFGETESYGRAALKKKSLTSGYSEKMDNRNDAADAATVAFGTGDYSIFTPYEKLFPKTAAKLKAALIPRQEAPTPSYEQPEVEAPADLGEPFSLAEEMEGVRAPLTSDIEGEIERLTKDQQEALAQRKNLEKRTAGTSLFQTLRGTLKDNELSELAGRARMVGKNQFLNLKAPRDKAGSSMENMVNSGKLDQFLPYNMRPGQPDYDNGESAEYIREKLRNNQFYTYETELAIRQLDQDIESIERQIEELLSDDDINKELQYAANEQREIDQATQEPAAPVADRAAQQREREASDDELDKREAQLDREAELNQREARLLEERKRLEEERLKLESPTKEDVKQQQERKAKAEELDEREQVRKESEAGAGQFELTREEGRRDTTGDIFNQPEPEVVAISTEQERKEALDQFKVRLTLPILPFTAVSANKTQRLKPAPLNASQKREILGLASEAVDLGLPPSVLLNVTAAGSTRMNATAVMATDGSLMIAKSWPLASKAQKLQVLIHELAHAVDTAAGDIANTASWAKAHAELQNWYANSPNKFQHPLHYPFAPQYKGRVRPKQESFAQAFSFYFTSPVDLQKNAPEAYSQIQSTVERIQDESQRARAAGATATSTAGIKIQPTRTAQGAAVQPAAGAKRTGVGTAPRLEDRGAGEVTKPSPVTFYEDIPNESWLQGKVDYAIRSPRNEFGVPKMSSVTGSFRNPVMIPTRWLTDAKGQRGEENNVRQKDLDAIRKIIRETGKFPLNEDGSEYVPYIEIGYDGKPWVSEGNHRIMAAIAEGLEYIPVELRYFDGGQRRAGKWNPENVKEITERLSAVSPEVQDINAAIAGKNIFDRKPLANWTMPDSTNLDSFIYFMQNKQIDMKDAVQAIKDNVGKIDERFDPYMKETLFAGRAATQTKRFLQNEVEPLFKEMGRLDVNMSELEEYLQNRHAQERNEQIAKVNPGMPDKGSGIETADAKAYLAGLTPEQEAKYKKLAGMVDAITAGTRQLLVDSGLESQDTIDVWESTYDNYVPLNREDVDYSSNHGMGVGQGYSVRGPASRRAVGSERQVVDILANIVMQRERNIVRAEKNRVAMALYGMAIQNPNPEFFLAVNPDAKKDIAKATQELVDMGFLPSDINSLMKEPSTMEIDPKTGLAIERVHQMQRGADNVMALRVNGENRYVFFNQNNERAKRMATAIKNLDADKLGFILSTTADITRFLASMNTQYNPIFGAYNFLRDVSTAGLQLTNTPLAGKQKEVLKPSNVFGAMRGIYTDLRAERGGKAGTSEWSKLWEEFQQRGGQTGFRDQFSSTAKRGEALQRIVDPSSWADQGLGKVFTAGGKLKVPMEVARKAAAPIFNWLSDYNETMENAIRLSAYKTALDNGMSKDAAAVLAKELTVNFNRKGQVAAQAGALYAFFNASVQGTTALIRTLSGPAGKAIIGGGLMLGGIQAMLYSLAGFDEGEPPEFIREKNFVMPIGNGKYVAIPLPLGYNVIPNTARLITEDVIRFTQGKKIKPVDTAFKVFESLLGSFNPIGNAGWSFQTAAPTVADPIVAIMENRDWTGKKIAREDFNALDPTPGFTRYKESSTSFGRALAEFMNSMSGGTEDAPGRISPTPDQIDYLVGQIFGGVGREAMKIERTIRSRFTGEELPAQAIPIAGRFYGDTKGSSAVSNAFYENLKQMNIHENTVKGMRKRKENVQEYFRDNPEARMFEEAGRVEREVQALRKRRRELVEKKAPKESVRAIEERITARMKRFNDKVKQREEKKN